MPTDSRDFRMVETCNLCPEQYQVYLGDRKVGYIRLRWGHLTVDCPDCGEDEVYQHQFPDQWQGCFDDDAQRTKYMNLARLHIADWLDHHGGGDEKADSGDASGG